MGKGMEYFRDSQVRKSNSRANIGVGERRATSKEVAGEREREARPQSSEAPDGPSRGEPPKNSLLDKRSKRRPLAKSLSKSKKMLAEKWLSSEKPRLTLLLPGLLSGELLERLPISKR